MPIAELHVHISEPNYSLDIFVNKDVGKIKFCLKLSKLVEGRGEVNLNYVFLVSSYEC
jgi:hypothetical protein